MIGVRNSTPRAAAIHAAVILHLALLLPGGTIGAGTVPSARAAIPADLDATIERGMRDWKVPGLALVVARKDGIVTARGYGVREIGRPERVDANTLFAVASNTKAVTATALGLLVADKRLAWDDPVTRFLPEFAMDDAWVTREMTVRDLLTHRSGLATWAGDLIWYGSDLDRAEVLRRVRHVPPATSFRSAYGYCNLTFIAAGEIIPKITGTSWDDFVRQKFFGPLGMRRTNTRVADLARLKNVAAPHTPLDGKVTAIPYRDVDNTGPAGAINSSVTEWAQWLRLQLGRGEIDGRRLVPAEIIDATRTPQSVLPLGERSRRLSPTTHFQAYGLGWFLRDYHGRLLVWHTGGMDGMLSIAGFLPEEDLAVAVFTNLDEQELYTAVFHTVVDALLGLPARDWSTILLEEHRKEQQELKPPRRVEGTRPSLSPGDYAGTYSNPMLGEARVVLRDGRLDVEFARHKGLRGPLRHWHYDTFECVWADRYYHTSLVVFTVDAEGRARDFRVRIREDFVDPLEYLFTRSSEPGRQGSARAKGEDHGRARLQEHRADRDIEEEPRGRRRKGDRQGVEDAPQPALVPGRRDPGRRRGREGRNVAGHREDRLHARLSPPGEWAR